ncbi:MAG TPA: LacI family DNA-binding transcriptional regulator [Acidimicrobiales bacterium]|nr:LacI family DNA-binding transcriptional regulator [Acidimicrobiales bacterium]
MGKRPISIATVAVEAGVGVGTVSRVLNGSAQVSEATRNRVLSTMERLDYRPLRSASSLSKGRTDSVGILVSVITRPSVMARLVGVIDVLSDASLDAVVFNVENRAQLDRHLASIIDQRRVDGIISISLRIPKERLTRIRKHSIPLVLVDNSAPSIPCVCIDDVAGGRIATDHLLSLGHRRIGFIGDNANSDLGMSASEDRYVGYLTALEAAGIEPDFDLVARGPHSSEAAAVLTNALFELSKHRPTAIFASSDTLAVGVVKAAQQCGLNIPEDIAVIGFDNLEVSSTLDISTVNQPLLESGIRGATKMVSLLNGEIVKPHREELPLEVVPRGSSLGNQRNSSTKLYGVVEGPQGLQILQGEEELVS